MQFVLADELINIVPEFLPECQLGTFRKIGFDYLFCWISKLQSLFYEYW